MKLINPLEIEQKDLPLFIVSDDLQAFMSWGIRAHGKGSYSHAMIMVDSGKVVTQGWTYKEIPVGKYMKSGIRLKFWQCSNLSKGTKEAIAKAVRRDLTQPWWRKRYDGIGILGQALHIRWLNNPRTYYCSERVAKYIRIIPIPMSQHPSPSEINQIFKETDRMKIFGYYDSDLEE